MDTTVKIERDSYIGSSHWRADHQIGGICSECFGESFLVCDFSGRLIRQRSSDGQRLRVWNPNIGQLNCVSTNGDIAVCGGTHEIALIDLGSDRQTCIIPTVGAVLAVAFCDESRFCILDDLGGLAVGAVGETLLEKIGLPEEATAVAIASDEIRGRLLVASHDRVFALDANESWNATELTRDCDHIRAISMTCDGRVVFASDSGVLRSDVDGVRWQKEYADTELGNIECLSICPESNRVAVCHQSQAVLLDAGSLSVITRSRKFDWITSIDFVSAGVAVFGAAPQSVEVIHGSNEYSIRSNGGHRSWVNGVASNSQGSMVLSTSRSCDLLLHSGDGAIVGRHTWSQWRRLAFAGKTDDGLVVSLHRKGAATLEFLESDTARTFTFKEILRSSDVEEAVVAFNHVAFVSENRLKVLQLPTNDSVLDIDFPLSEVGTLALARDRVFATGLSDGVAEIELKTQKVTKFRVDRLSAYLYRSTYSPATDSAIVIDDEYGLLLSVSKGRINVIMECEPLSRASCLTADAISPCICVGTECGHVFVIDVTQSKLVAQLSLDSSVQSIHFRYPQLAVGLGNCTAVTYSLRDS